MNEKQRICLIANSRFRNGIIKKTNPKPNASIQNSGNAFLMLIGSQSHAFEYSNLCEVMKTATPQSKGLASQITPGIFSCNEDQALSVIYSLEGGNSTALSTIKPILKSGGMSEDHFSTPNPVLDAFTSYMWNMIIIIVGALTGYIVYRFWLTGIKAKAFKHR